MDSLEGFLNLLEFDAGHRWPLNRTGQRERITWLVRLSVYRRGGFTCRICGWVGDHDIKALALDHRIPWSAGGSDASDNLRVLCHRCNTLRSNYRDTAHLDHIRPTTWWCTNCWTEDNHNYQRHKPWRDSTCLEMAPWVEDPTTLAFCAICEDYSYTDKPLTAELIPELVTLTFATRSPWQPGEVAS